MKKERRENVTSEKYHKNVAVGQIQIITKKITVNYNTTETVMLIMQEH